MELVVCFLHEHKAQVLDYFAQNNHLNLVLKQDEKHIFICINRKKTYEFHQWLDETIEIMNYHQYRDFFFALFDKSILYLYMACDEMTDECNLKFTAPQMMVLRKLSTIIDFDYGVYF